MTTPSDYPFHRKRSVNWKSVAIGVAITVIVATLMGMVSIAKSAWASKANVSDVQEINKKLDDIIVRVTQIQCGKRVEEGCR